MTTEKIITEEKNAENNAQRAEERGEMQAEESAERIIVRPEKPYVFEGKEYEEIDLTGLNALTIKDAIDAQRQLFSEQEVAASVLCEATTAFARTMAAKATGTEWRPMWGQSSWRAAPPSG